MSSKMMTAVGSAGGAVIISAYFLISEGLLSGSSLSYHVLNLTGSILLASDLYTKRAWSGVSLQMVFSSIAIWSLVRLNFF